VEGVVEARNDTGIRINGTWANRSRFKPVELPDVGTLVRVGLDPKGFINTLEVLGSENGATIPAPFSTATRDRTITRLAVLKAAAAFCALRPTCKSSDVLTVADRWIEWVESVTVAE
jgi:hypothetical protein